MKGDFSVKIEDIAAKYYLDEVAFKNYIKQSGLPYEKTAGSISIPDIYVKDCVESFWEYNEEQERARKEAEREAQDKRRAMSQMLISSGFSFEGYKIVKYSGYISGDDATQIPRSGVFGGHNGENLTMALVRIRRQALAELKEAAYDLGCNAVVGVDFDYITLEPETANIGGGTLYEPYIICVTANGNAVVIEKEDEK